MENEKRLIDANFLDDRCRQQMDDEWNKRVAPTSWSEAYNEFLDDVWDAPTVDAVEVVHGRWINSHTVAFTEECSQCGFCVDWTENGMLHNYNYCPNCGAKMDGDGNED